MFFFAAILFRGRIEASLNSRSPSDAKAAIAVAQLPHLQLGEWQKAKYGLCWGQGQFSAAYNLTVDGFD